MILLKTTKIFSVILAIIMVLGTCIIANAAETTEIKTGVITNATESVLYAHGVKGSSEETEAWQKMQLNYADHCYYFYLPSGVDDQKVEIYNNSAFEAVIGGTTIPPKTAVLFDYNTNESYQMKIGSRTNTLKFMKSTAESAVYINNSNADGNGTGLWEYLSLDKSNEASATGAIVDKDGSVDNTSIKKIKGRGNTTWDKDKKPFNVTYNERVSIDSMESGKKYSFLANYQDASLSRNRFLYDLSDEVGMPYASDSRYIDFYVDGEYKGSYLAAQKVDTGKGNLLSDIDETGYLNPNDGTMAENFAFVCEIDASAGDDDYTFYSQSGNNVTMKTPELSWGEQYYNEVLDYAQDKFDTMFFAIEDNVSNLDEIIDIDSLAKLYLINELGKNWDSGVSSTFFTYKQDENGNWKFFASPVWDYDNSLGNATGVDYDLRAMGVYDYEEPTGWWCKYKGSSRYGYTNNIMNLVANNPKVMDASKRIWSDTFVPALKKFSSTEVSSGELFSSDVYYNYLSGSADMNYTSGWQLNTGSWICDHSRLNVCTYDYDTGTFSQSSNETKYDISTFKGEYDYTVDWMTSRAAWLSSQLYDPAYVKPTTEPTTEPASTEPTTEPVSTAPTTEPVSTEPTTEPASTEPTTENPIYENILAGDTNLDKYINVKDATLIQLYVAKLGTLNNKELFAANVDADNDVNVKDATYIQLYCAGLDSEGSLVGTYKKYSEDPTDKPTDPKPTETQPTETQPEDIVSKYEQEVFDLVNKVREENNLSPYTYNAKLSDVARIKAQDMKDNNYFDHTSPTYGTPYEMMTQFGIKYTAAAENIAQGYPTPEAVVDGWMHSAGHRANILDPEFTQIGIGYVADGNYWTQMFIA